MNERLIAEELTKIAAILKNEDIDLSGIDIPDLSSLKESIEDDQNAQDGITIENVIEAINSKEFGFIGIHAVLSGNFVRMSLEEAKFGIDFGNADDVETYSKNEHDAMDYAEKIWKPIIENNFPGITVVLPRNTSVWYDMNKEDFDNMR